MNPTEPSLVHAIMAEYRRYKALGDGALAQLAEGEATQPGPNGANSIAMIVWHLSGNLASRFTDFLTTDGEKPWRRRDEEFAQRQVSRAEVQQKWEHGWTVLFAALTALSDADLHRSVTIRGKGLLVQDALLRSLAHAGYHVGQIVYIARGLRGARWSFLSIPPGGSAAYNQNPDRERPASHAESLQPPPKPTT